MAQSRLGTVGNMYLSQSALFSIVIHTLRMCEPSDDLRKAWGKVAAVVLPGPRGWTRGSTCQHSHGDLRSGCAQPCCGAIAELDPLAGWRAHGRIATYNKVARWLQGLGLAVIPRDCTRGCLQLSGTETNFKRQLLLQFVPKLQVVKDRLQQRLYDAVRGEAYPAWLVKDSSSLTFWWCAACFASDRRHSQWL
eukprot:2025336-Amphidinium_carterae.1